MKMRWWIAILLLLNAMTLAWQWDAFAPWGWGPNVQREPERLKQQIKPEALQITLPGQAASAPAAASEAPASKAAASEPTPPKTSASTPTAAAAAAAPAKPASK
jgi:hypothetical protein